MVLAILQGFVEGQPVLTAYALLVLVPVLYSYLSKGKPQFLFMHKSKWLTDRVTDFSKAHGRSVELMATLGIVLGTGLFGLHYVLSRHKSPYNSVLFVFGAIVFASLNWWFVYSQQFGLISEFGRALSVPLMTLFGLSFFLVVALGDYSFTVVQGILEAKKTCPTVAPVLPGVSLPGFGVSIPLIEGWIALMVAMFVHELSHGVLMQRFRSGLESVG
ncbi:MAG TPA: hypothetical protein VJI67_01105, partial [archaeon]|nr:hypothetical protein [archaeon]